MHISLGGLLLGGYGAAALAAVGALTAGADPLWAALGVWVGGALATMALAAALSALRRAPASTDAEAETEAFAQAAARWERDRLGDVAPAQERASA